ncbi:unnamed protein product [Orchesella dallaii]|uniref:Apolipoprotein D n=1 Tax=Orchesella dallaii TaxID=48710 RepID=A0ABP1PW26_9HEXA
MKPECWIFLFCVTAVVYGVDEDRLKTLPCRPVDPVDLDLTWYRSVKLWYSPLSHKLELYRTSRELLQVAAEDIPEHDIYYEACITYQPSEEEDGYTVKGFGNRESFVRTASTDNPGAQLIESDYKYGANGNGTIIYTDNKSYILNAICDRRTLVWNVWSVSPSLDSKTVSKIFAKIQKMGFYKENFVMFKYEICKNLPKA